MTDKDLEKIAEIIAGAGKCRRDTVDHCDGCIIEAHFLYDGECTIDGALDGVLEIALALFNGLSEEEQQTLFELII